MTNVVKCTVWWAETGEPYTLCRAVENKLDPGEDKRVWWGGHIDPVTHKFDIETGLPTLRDAPMEVPQDDLYVEVNRERKSRIEVGKDFDGIWVTGSDRDQINLLALKDTARDLQAAGIDAAIIPFRDGNNTEHMLTAGQIIDLANAGKAYVSAIYQASWALKAMDPIPQDVNADEWWP